MTSPKRSFEKAGTNVGRMVAEEEIWIFVFLISARFKDEGGREILLAQRSI
jgi:hypothetical protein